MVRMTKQRKIILEEVRRDKSHPTADVIFRKVRRRLPRISLGTIYRNLEILAQYGMIQKIDTSYDRMRFDGDTSDHCHIRCIRCGRVNDIYVSPVVKVEEGGLECDYEVTGHKVEFFGICPSCRMISQ